MASQQQTTLSRPQQEVLDALSQGSIDVGSIAQAIGKSVATVRGNLRQLRDNGLVDGISGSLEITSDGRAFAGGGQQGGNQGGRQAGQQGGNQGNQGNQGGGNDGGNTKIDHARQIFQQRVGDGRAAVIQAFQEEAGLTYAGASTYYQRLRTETGMNQSNQNARGQGGNQRGGQRGGNQGQRANANGGNRSNQGGGGQLNASGNRRGMNRGGSNQGGGNRGNANQGEQLNASGNRRGMNRNSGNRTQGNQRAGGRGNANSGNSGRAR